VSPCPTVLLVALGSEILKQKADAGDRAAQFSQGMRLMVEAGVFDAGGVSATGRHPTAQVGWHVAPFPPLT
jgi:hypothetical protein